MRDCLNEIKKLEGENKYIRGKLDVLDDHINDLYKRFGDELFATHSHEYVRINWLWERWNKIMRRNNLEIDRLREEYKALHDNGYTATSMIDIYESIDRDGYIIRIKF